MPTLVLANIVPIPINRLSKPYTSVFFTYSTLKTFAFVHRFMATMKTAGGFPTLVRGEPEALAAAAGIAERAWLFSGRFIGFNDDEQSLGGCARMQGSCSVVAIYQSTHSERLLNS